MIVQYVSMFFTMFGAKMFDKIHMNRNPASEKCPPTGLKCLLRRRMLCRFEEKRSIIDGHLRRGDTGQKIWGKYIMKVLQTSSNIYKLPAIADDCCSILLAVLLHANPVPVCYS